MTEYGRREVNANSLQSLTLGFVDRHAESWLDRNLSPRKMVGCANVVVKELDAGQEGDLASIRPGYDLGSDGTGSHLTDQKACTVHQAVLGVNVPEQYDWLVDLESEHVWW